MYIMLKLKRFPLCEFHAFDSQVVSKMNEIFYFILFPTQG